MKELVDLRYIRKAIDIGKDLIDQSITINRSTFWDTFSADIKNNLVKNHVTNLYSGVSGISLFLIELFKITNTKIFLDTAINGFRWVNDNISESPDSSYAFLTGKMGLSYSLMRLYEVTKIEKYKIESLNIAKHCDLTLNNNSKCEYLSGVSGCLLVLLYLHSRTNQAFLLDKINIIIGHLIDNLHIGKKGFFWDKSNSEVQGLCGFSHGAAGIGFVFLELGNYFKNPSFYYIAEQAFKYESMHFDKEVNNWHDLRRKIYSDETLRQYIKAYKDNKINSFTNWSDTFCWCHGGVGIGFSRLRALELLTNSKYKSTLYSIINRIVVENLNNTNSSFTICHGRGADADLCISAFQSLKDIKLLYLARSIGENAIMFYTQNRYYKSGYETLEAKTEDYSLFNGNAGIGYLFLRLGNPISTSSILAPSIKGNFDLKHISQKNQNIHITLDVLRRTIYSKILGRSFIFMSSLPNGNSIIEKTLDINLNHLETKKEILKRLMQSSKAIKINNKKILVSILRFENLKIKLNDKQISYSYCRVRNVILQEEFIKISTLNETDFSSLRLRLNPYSKLIKSYNWNECGSDISTLLSHSKNCHILLLQEKDQINEIYISDFTYYIMDLIKKYGVLKLVYKNMAKILNEKLNQDETKKFNITIKNQIIQLLRSKVIIIDNIYLNTDR